MNGQDLFEKWNQYSRKKKELDAAVGGQSAVRQRVQKEVNERFDTLASNVGQFCGGTSFRSVIRDFCYLYPDTLSVTATGDLAYCRRVPPAAACGADRAVALAEEGVRAVKTAVRAIATKTGDVNLQLRTLCMAFATLRHICARIPALKEEAVRAAMAEEHARVDAIRAEVDAMLAENPDFAHPEKIKAQLDALKERARLAADRFAFRSMTVESDYATHPSIPFAKETDGNIHCWEPSRDGLLFVGDDGANSDTVFDFIRGVTMQFLHAYPAADKQIFYASMQADGGMDIFISSLAENLGESIFFRGMQQIEAGDFDHIVAEQCQFLRDEVKNRLLLLSKTGKNDVFAYNAANPKNIQKPILVIFKDYPNGFDYTNNLQYLFSSAARAGVFFLVTGNTAQPENSYRSSNAVDAAPYSHHKCAFRGGALVSESEPLTPVSLPAGEETMLLTALGASAKKVKKQVVSYRDIGFGSFEGSDVLKGKISIPVGTAGNRVACIDFSSSGKQNSNVPIAYLLLGLPKMGKSSLIDAMIINGAMTYSPDDLIFYMLDFKDGLAAATYKGENAIPHVRVIAENNKPEDANIILSSLLSEMSRRNELFKKNGVQHIDGYNALHEKHMPRIVIVIDECQVLFEEDALAKKCEDIVRLGRSAGIHLVMATQKVSQQMMNKAGDFMDGRFCFRAGAASAEQVVAREHAQNAPLLEVGVAMASTNGGRNCETVRMAWHDDKIPEFNRAIREKWLPLGHKIKLTVAGESSPLTLEALCREENVLSAAPHMEIPVAENYFDHSLISLDFTESAERGKKHSVLVLGKNEQAGAHIFTAIMAGALRAGAEVHAVDESDSQALQRRFGRGMGADVHGAEGYLSLLGNAMAEARRRAENRRGQYKPYFLVLHCLHNVNAFAENTLQKGSSTPAAPAPREAGAPRRFDAASFRSRAAGSGEDVKGRDTLIELIKKLPSAPAMFLMVSTIETTDFGSSADRGVFKGMDYKLLLSDVGEKVRDTMEDAFRLNMVTGMSPNMMLVAHAGSFIKARYLQFGEDAATRTMLEGLRSSAPTDRREMRREVAPTRAAEPPRVSDASPADTNMSRYGERNAPKSPDRTPRPDTRGEETREQKDKTATPTNPKGVSFSDIGFGSTVGDASRGSISIPVGMANGAPYQLRFSTRGDAPLAYLAAGMSATGKSTLLETVILNGAMAYSPKELNFLLLDLKSGVGFSAYTDECPLPHVRALNGASRPDTGAALEGVMQEIRRRQTALRQAGAFNIDSYNKENQSHIPHTVVIIDEAEEIFLDMELSSMLEMIVRVGRSVGVHLLLAVQRVSPQMMQTVDMCMDGRICFRADAATASNLLMRSLSKNTETLACGEAMISTDSGMSAESVRVAWHGNERNVLCRRILEKWQL